MNSTETTNGLARLLSKENVHVQLSVPQLVVKVLSRNEGELSSTCAVSVATGKYTGRSRKDKFIVDEPSIKNKIDWGTVTQPFFGKTFSKLYDKVIAYLDQKEEVFVFNGFAGADKKSQLPIQVINEYA